MSILLNIDTAITQTGVCIAKNGNVIAHLISDGHSKDKAVLHQMIQELLAETKLTLPELDAVGVVEGPGSYTGLRVGLAAAKGICYALNKPLIVVNSLETLAYQAKKTESADLYCPMIDARRMEVFTAVYDSEISEVIKPQAMVLNEGSFGDIFERFRVVTCGNGAPKFHSKFENKPAKQVVINNYFPALSELADGRFLKGKFANVAHHEPLYMKEFYTGSN